jgi:pimeloyl-ACP methyl ester carboxylesterase
VDNQPDVNNQHEERAGYFPVSGAHLYTVLHEVKDPVARVLLVGPFASERHNSYLPWVRWARSLAADHIEVLRYDYRGIGESTGVFEQMTFADWSDDVRLLAAWLINRSPNVPLILHGLGLGAVLAGRAFDEGIGDGLLLWSPPANANQALRATLIRWVGLEQIFKFGDERKSASEYIRQLEQGAPLDVDGYRWQPKLWNDSFQFTLPAAFQSEATAAEASKRPVKLVKLTRDAAPLTKGGLVGYDDLKDFNWLYAPSREWIAAVAVECAEQCAPGATHA